MDINLYKINKTTVCSNKNLTNSLSHVDETELLGKKLKRKGQYVSEGRYWHNNLCWILSSKFQVRSERVEKSCEKESAVKASVNVKETEQYEACM